MTKPKKKLYIVRKYIEAHSVRQALRLERKREPDDVWVDDDWKKDNRLDLKSAIGFEIE